MLAGGNRKVSRNNTYFFRMLRLIRESMIGDWEGFVPGAEAICPLEYDRFMHGDSPLHVVAVLAGFYPGKNKIHSLFYRNTW